MKKLCVISLVVALAATMAAGQEIRLGGHAAYLAGNNILKDPLGYGAQLTAQINDFLAIEAAGTWFKDRRPDASLDITTVALTAKFGGSPAEGVYLYAGGGANYTLADVVQWAVSDVDPAVGYHFCGGVTLNVYQRLDLFAEYRGTGLSFKTPGSDAPPADFVPDYDFGLVFLGVNYNL